MRLSFYCLQGGIFCHLGCYSFFLDTVGRNLVSLHKISLCPYQFVCPCQIRISHIVFCTFPNLSKSFISPAHCHRLLVWHKTQAQNEKDKPEKRQQTLLLLLCFLLSRSQNMLNNTIILLVSQTTRCISSCLINSIYTWNILHPPIRGSKVHHGNRQRNISLSNGHKPAITTWY